MKPMLVMLLFLLAMPLPAQQASRHGVASFTPRGVMNAVRETGWMHLGESNESSFWYAYWTGDPSQGTGVILKSADKSIGDTYTTIKVIVGFADCRGAKEGNYPTYLMNTSIEVDDAATGYPPPGYSDVPMLGPVPLQRGTALAEAVKRSCDRASASH
jgi:hypothetical protein